MTTITMNKSTSNSSSSSSSTSLSSVSSDGSCESDVLAKFRRKELVIGEMLEYSNDVCKYYAIDGVHLRAKNKQQHPFRQEVAQHPHLYAAMVVSDSNADAAQLLSDLSHDHVLGVYGVYTTKSNVLLIVDRIMCTVAECLDHWSSRNTPPPLLERLYVAHHTASALYYLHTNSKVVLGDLCPANVGFDMRGNLRIMNFTSARCMEKECNKYVNNDKSIERALSTLYTPPEVSGGHLASPASDVFSYTLFVWELFMLMPARTNESQEYIAMIHDSNWPLWTKDIITHGLCADVQKRTNMRDIQRCLWRVLQQEDEKEQLRKKGTIK